MHPGHGVPAAAQAQPATLEAIARQEEERKRKEAEDAAALAASLIPAIPSADDEGDPYAPGAGLDDPTEGLDIPGAEAAGAGDLDLGLGLAPSGLAGLGDEPLKLGDMGLGGVKGIAGGAGTAEAMSEANILAGLLEGWPTGSSGIGGSMYDPRGPNARNAAINALRLGQGDIGKGTAYGVGRPGTETFGAEAAGVGRSAALQGMGAKALGGMAAGQVAPAMQTQRDQGIRDILAMKAGARGPVGVAERAATQATGQLGAGLVGQAGQLQLQAAGQAAQLEEAGAGRVDALTQLQAQFQQAAGMSNAQMQQQNAQFNSQIDTQLAMERDKRINELVGQGTNIDIAMMQVDAEMEKARAELLYREWADMLSRQTQIDVAMMENAPWDMQYNPDTGQYEKTTTGKAVSSLGGFFNEVGEWVSDNSNALITGGLSVLYDKLFGNKGGVVPGIGHTDTQPAMLTPGEIVIPKELSEELIGVINRGAGQSGQYQAGGQVQRSNVDFTKAFPDLTSSFDLPPEDILAGIPGAAEAGAIDYNAPAPAWGPNPALPRPSISGQMGKARLGSPETVLAPEAEGMKAMAMMQAQGKLAGPMGPVGARVDDAMTQLRGSQTREFIKNNPMRPPPMPKARASVPTGPKFGSMTGEMDYKPQRVERDWSYQDPQSARPQDKEAAEESNALMDALGGARKAVGYANTAIGMRGGSRAQQATIQGLAKSELAAQAAKIPYAGKLVGPAMKAEAVINAPRGKDQIYAGRKLATDLGSKWAATAAGAPMLYKPIQEATDWLDETLFGGKPKPSRASSLGSPRTIGANKGGVVPGIQSLYNRLQPRIQMRGGGVVPNYKKGYK